MESEKESLPSLPHDVILDILSRLPVKSLLRFRSACKSWCSLISDPQFAKKHLNHANNGTTTAITAITTTTNLLRYGVLYFTSFPCISLSLSSMNCEGLDHSLIKLNTPLVDSNFYAEILGSCNGLLLVGVGARALVLWNPSIRSHEWFSHPYNMHSTEKYTLNALGFDSSTGGYKMVSIVNDVPPPPPSGDGSYLALRRELERRGRVRRQDRHLEGTRIEVFNFTTLCCEKIEVSSFPYKLVSTKQAIVVNGAPHWVLSRGESDYVIVCFDFMEEKFREVPKPGWLLGESAEFGLGVVRGWLCVVFGEFEVWGMKEYGVEESWTKLIVIEMQSFGDMITPLCLRKNGEVVIEVDRKKLVVYNPCEKTKEVLMLTKNQDRFHGVTYVESLISP